MEGEFLLSLIGRGMVLVMVGLVRCVATERVRIPWLRKQRFLIPIPLHLCGQ